MTIWTRGRWHLCFAFVLAACGQGGLTTTDPEDNVVPTVAFVTFEAGSAEVSEDGVTLLRDAARYARRYENVSLSVAGHSTDAEVVENADLDLERINESVKLLRRYGVPEDKITRIPRGNAEKVDPTDPESEANRRVDVLFVVLVEQQTAQATTVAQDTERR